MKGKGHFLYPVFALLFQPLPMLFIWRMGASAFGKSHWFPEAWVWHVSVVGLALCALVSLALACMGTYTLLTRSHWLTASVMIVFFCIPAFIAGAVYLYATLVFLTFV